MSHASSGRRKLTLPDVLIPILSLYDKWFSRCTKYTKNAKVKYLYDVICRNFYRKSYQSKPQAF